MNPTRLCFDISDPTVASPAVVEELAVSIRSGSAEDSRFENEQVTRSAASVTNGKPVSETVPAPSQPNQNKERRMDLVSTRVFAQHPEVIARDLKEEDLRALAKCGVIPHQIVAGKFCFNETEAVAALIKYGEATGSFKKKAVKKQPLDNKRNAALRKLEAAVGAMIRNDGMTGSVWYEKVGVAYIELADSEL